MCKTTLNTVVAAMLNALECAAPASACPIAIRRAGASASIFRLTLPTVAAVQLYAQLSSPVSREFAPSSVLVAPTFVTVAASTIKSTPTTVVGAGSFVPTLKCAALAAAGSRALLRPRTVMVHAWTHASTPATVVGAT
jgi:hypothetical protein